VNQAARLVGALLVLLFLAAPAGAADRGALAFQTQPAGAYAGDPAAGMVRETSPEEVTGLRVDATVGASWCDAGGRYAWSGPEATEQVNGCTFRLTFPARGTYEVTLTAKVGDDESTVTQSVEVRGLLIVVMGDSIASGEGVPDIDGRPATWQDERCHRSARAGPALAAAALQERAPETPITFVSVACSGATIDAGLLGGYEGIVHKSQRPLVPPQINAVEAIHARRPIDALVVSVGANDVFFGKVVKKCLGRMGLPRRDCFASKVKFGGLKRGRAMREVVGDAIRGLENRYAALGAKLKALNPRLGDVYLMQYFDPIADAAGNTCPGRVLRIRQKALREARTALLAPLNAAGRTAAEDLDWHYVDGIEPLFRGHGYCAARPDLWVVRLQNTLRQQGGITGALHPNAQGHREIAARLADALAVKFALPRTKTAAADDEEIPDWVATGFGAGGTIAAFALAGVGFVRSRTGRRLRARRAS
jgi:lysophospholipase L1-like esterase